MADLDTLRATIRDHTLAPDTAVVGEAVATAALSPDERRAIVAAATGLVEAVRARGAGGLMESFLGEFGLSTTEGIALMCLAEALLRVPDAGTVDDLIRDKIAPGDWARHLGHANSPLVNASTWALMLTGRVLDEARETDLAGILHRAVRRLGEPIIRTAVAQAMRQLGDHFVLGRSIEEAMARASRREARGFTYSYDMLGEAARTEADAVRYFDAYADAITAIGRRPAADIRTAPGISVKLSALDPRYDYAQRERLLPRLVDRLLRLARMAAAAGIGFNADAEEAERLDLSLDIIERVVAAPDLAGWDGFGIVVQAYGRRALPLIDWIAALARRHDRRLMVRLVKGAYWDSEIKRAQLLGLEGFPVLTRKAATDVNYLAAARRLFAHAGRLYPQFATHNAHTVAAILAMAPDRDTFEFQRLHGMGAALHDIVAERHGTRCRIYAPVGRHRDLLAYLVRRLLENGANSSFVNQIVDVSVPAAQVARDPFAVVEGHGKALGNPAIRMPADLFAPSRRNSRGYDLSDPVTVAALRAARDRFAAHRWHAGPLLGAGAADRDRPSRSIVNPARPDELVGTVSDAVAADIDDAFAAATGAFPGWSARPATERADILERAADLYEAHAPELMALAAREAGKTWLDAVGEVREAVDFCRTYAAEARRYAAEGRAGGRGVFVCISPWNFPLAIFTGQVAAALAAGNSVLAKPAEQTPLIAARAVALIHAAGVPADVLQLLPGDGPQVGAPLAADPRLAGLCFTGSLATAHAIDRTMAAAAPPDAPLIAETGGINAMIVDSTALPEQAVRDILASAFQSAGQRCSALRVLYLQREIAERTLAMLAGAMDALVVGDPSALATDIGPVIDDEAREQLLAYCRERTAEGRLVKTIPVPDEGRFVAPTVFRVSGIEEVTREVFGPVLHVATFAAEELDSVVAAVNAAGYGLTFAIHSRIDDRVERAVSAARIGNIYVNRNQIGAVVGAQPFGGEGLSGTGPKAGGPLYLGRFLAPAPAPDLPDASAVARSFGQGPDRVALEAALASLRDTTGTPGEGRARLEAFLARLPGTFARPVRVALAAAAALPTLPVTLPGPTGESNRLTVHPRGTVLCLGRPDAEDDGLAALVQAVPALAAGNPVVLAAVGSGWLAGPAAAAGLPLAILDGTPPADWLTDLAGIAAVAVAGPAAVLRPYRVALAARDGPILPLVADLVDPARHLIERCVSIDTTAAGGNATLLAAAEP